MAPPPHVRGSNTGAFRVPTVGDVVGGGSRHLHLLRRRRRASEKSGKNGYVADKPSEETPQSHDTMSNFTAGNLKSSVPSFHRSVWLEYLPASS